MKSAVLLLLLLSLMCITVSAIPGTPTVTLIGSNNVTFGSSGAATICWFRWGELGNGGELWKTSNQTSAAGVCNATIYGTPLSGATVYYVQAVDTTGNSTLSTTFTTLAIVPNPTTTYGIVYRNVTETGFSPLFIMANTLAPYYWVSPTAFIWGFLFAIIYVGYWIRGRGIVIPALLGFCTGSLFLYSNAGLNLGIPLEFTAIAQGIAYAGIAGIILGLIKR